MTVNPLIANVQYLLNKTNVSEVESKQIDTLLDMVRRKLLSGGFSFNQRRVTIEIDEQGRYPVSERTILVYMDGVDGYTVKGGYLFNSFDNNYDVTPLNGLQAQLQYNIPYNELPHIVQDYLVFKVAALYTRTNSNVYDKIKADQYSAEAKDIMNILVTQYTNSDTEDFLTEFTPTTPATLTG